MAANPEVSWSDLLNSPTPTVEKLATGSGRALRIRRRDAEDLVLTTAARADQDEELVDIARRMFFAVMSDPIARSQHMVDVLPKVFPWVRFLPQTDLVAFLQELVDVFEASRDLDTPAPVLDAIAQWRHTAQAYADPELLALLRRDVEDAGPVPVPAA